ncbi:helix-turn-helix transcriptional regulator [uncultured Draconibacterium sp.]|uniref:helix-turn-helix transcriptional regulator n=1 Tax=uncultured Draconibacterium sp. TaxID=1573823 RepID=UPI0025DC990B|nr:helix-turn-helix transcriptional regulator [uncultured Draconibacterium sp.]
MEKIHERIKHLRSEKKLTQSEIADIIGVTRATYVFIENGKTQNISIEVGKGIARALEVPFSLLFDVEIASDQNLTDRIEGLEKEVAKLKLELEKEKKYSSLVTKINKDLENENFKIILNGHFEEMLKIDKQIDSCDNEKRKHTYMVKKEAVKRVIRENIHMSRAHLFKSDFGLFHVMYSQDPSIFNLIQSTKDSEDFIDKLTGYWNEFVSVSRESVREFFDEIQGSGGGDPDSGV